MNKQILKIKQNFVLCLVMLSLLTLSCNRADMEEGHIGKSGFLVTLTDDVRVESRSTPAELEDPLNTDFDLKIIRTSTGETVYDGKFKEDLIQASAGFYQVTASFGTNPVLEVDAPYYEGTVTEVEVRKDTPAQVLVPCKVANALLSVVYGESIAKVYDFYYVTVAVGEESREIRDNESAYFRAGSVVNVWFHGTPIGESEERTFELLNERLTTPLEAGDHAILNLSIEAGVTVSVEKLEVKTTTVSETIPVEYMPKPKLESTDFVNNELSFGETAKKSAVINLKLASPLQDLKLKFTSADSKFAGLEQGREYLLSVAEDKAAVESALGITLPSVGDMKAALDFSSLVPQLMTDNGATVSSVIEVDAKANNRWSSDKEADALARTFTLNCNKPVFHVSIYPGNIWTKEFTVNHLLAEDVESGDYEALGQKMRYQFSTNGTDGWTDFGEDLRKADLIPGITYYIRGLYRDVIESDAVEVTTYPQIALENGDMEAWDYEITDDARNPITENLHKVYWKKWFPWSSVSSASVWNTVNQTTTQDGKTPNLGWLGATNPPYVGCCYVANSGTIPVEGEDAHNGKSALLKTVGWGSGNTGGGNASKINHVTPAELYLGTYDLANHKPVYGIEYASRPTAIKFWCKYVPKSTDLLIAQIIILDNEGMEIGGASIPTEEAGVTDWTEKTLSINYTDLKKAPAKMYVLFKSGTITDTGVMDKPPLANLSDGESVGSKLYIDDISLVYDK